MHTIVLAVGSIAATAAVAFVVLVVGMRAKATPVLNTVRRMNRFTKRFVLKSAGTAGSPTAAVHHVGRRSGGKYETPVVAARTDAGFAVALPYGMNTDWLKNVLSAGRGAIAYDGRVYEVDRPEVVQLATVESRFAAREQRLHRQFGVAEALVVRLANARV